MTCPAQLKAIVLKVQGRQDCAGTELIARSVGEPNDGAVPRAAIAATAFEPGGDARGDMDDEVTLMPSRRPMIFQVSGMETWDRVDVLETAVGNAVDHGFPPDRDKMLRNIVFRTHLDTFRRGFLGDLPANVEPKAVRLQLDARVVAPTRT